MRALPHKFNFRVNHYPGFTHGAVMNEWGDYEVKWARGYPEAIRGVPNKVVYSDVMELHVSTGAYIIVDEQKAEKEVAKANVKEALPDVFHFVLTDSSDATVFKATKGEHNYIVSWTEPSGEIGQTAYGLQMVQGIVRDKIWTIVDDLEIKIRNPQGFYFLNSCDEKVFALWDGEVIHFNNLFHNFKGVIEEDYMKRQLKMGYWKLHEQSTLTAEQIRTNKELNEQINALQSSVRISEQAEDHQKRLQASYKERIDVLKAKLVEGV